MSGPVEWIERHWLLHSRLLEELRRRRLSDMGGWSHCRSQFATEPTSLALLALHPGRSSSSASNEGITQLSARRRPNGTWPAAAEEAGVNIWATALAANAMIHVDANPAMLAPSLDSLIQCRPLEASWLVQLKFRFSDRQVRFDPTKYGWPWVPDTVSWVVPTAMVLITLERARRRGLATGSEIDNRLRLGAEMLLDRACADGGWNAGNAFVYGVPLRAHIDATAIALAALRPHYEQPVVRNSLTWLLDCIQCPSAHSLAWLILAVAMYREVRSDVTPVLAAARDRLAALVGDPKGIQDVHDCAGGARAWSWPYGQPLRGERMSTLVNRRIFGGVLLAGTGALAVQRMRSAGLVPDRRKPRSRVAILKETSYSGPLDRALVEGLGLFDLNLCGKNVLVKPNLVESIPGTEVNTNPRLVGAAATAFLALGAKSVVVAEGPGHQWDTQLVLKETGLARELRERGIRFVDLNRDEIAKRRLATRFTGLDCLWLPQTVLAADFVVSMPKVKTHHWAGVTLSMKNLFGVVPGIAYGWPKNMLHWRGIDRSILDINASVATHFVIADGIVGMEGNGPLHGTPRQLGRIVLADDPVAADFTCARLMGLNPLHVPYLAQAAEFLGNGALERIVQLAEQLPRSVEPFGLLIQLVTGIIEQGGFSGLRQRRAFRSPTGEVQEVISIGAQRTQGKLANPLSIEEGVGPGHFPAALIEHAPGRSAGGNGWSPGHGELHCRSAS